MNPRAKEERGKLLEPTEAGQVQSVHVGNDGLNLPNLARRGFLGGLAAFAAQCVIDPEFALWVPDQRSFFIPDAIVSPDEYYRVQSLATNAEALAAQREVIRPDLESLMMLSSLLWSKIQVRNDMPIGIGLKRPSRIPMSPLSGSGQALMAATNPFSSRIQLA